MLKDLKNIVQINLELVYFSENTIIVENFMAKLYFRHGTVGSAKTLNLLAVAHNYRQQGKEILLVNGQREETVFFDNSTKQKEIGPYFPYSLFYLCNRLFRVPSICHPNGCFWVDPYHIYECD